MKVKQLIKELQKFDGDMSVFLDDSFEVQKDIYLRKIKTEKEIIEDVFVVTKDDGYHTDLMRIKRPRYNKKSLNSNFPMALLISHSPDYKKISNARKKNLNP